MEGTPKCKKRKVKEVVGGGGGGREKAPRQVLMVNFSPSLVCLTSANDDGDVIFIKCKVRKLI